MFLQRLPHLAPKNSVKMEPRESRDGRQVLEFQFFIQMTLDVHERSHDALGVILFRRRFHKRASREAQNPKAGKVR